MEDTKCSTLTFFNDNLDYVFKELNCAAKVNLAFGFALKSNGDGMCRYFNITRTVPLSRGRNLYVHKLI